MDAVRDEPNGFNFENGAAQLASWFSGIELRRYQDSLFVTEPEPLIAYLLSMSRYNFNAEQLAKAVRQEFAAKGVVHIRKDAGAFVARKA